MEIKKVVQTIQTGKPIDFSIMPNFKCNLNCWFCMYDASPEFHSNLYLQYTADFLKQFNWEMINSFGFYGGEPSIQTELYDKYINLVPESIPKFIITNGTWSVSDKYTELFINWCALHRMRIIISSTPEHIKYQDRNFLINLQKEFPGAIELKQPDEIHAQGRAIGKPGVIQDCKLTCQRTDRNLRLGLKPDGNIIFQNCHGEYHIIQRYTDPFEGIIERTQKIVDDCYNKTISNKLKD
jgi:organic radical activating enzyme